MLSTINYYYSRYTGQPISDPSISYRWKICAVVDALIIARFHRSIFNSVHMTASLFTSSRIEKTATIALYGIGGIAALYGVSLGVRCCSQKKKEYQKNQLAAEKANIAAKAGAYRKNVANRLSDLIKRTVKDPQNGDQLDQLCKALNDFYQTVEASQLSEDCAEYKEKLSYYMTYPQVNSIGRGKDEIVFISISRGDDTKNLKLNRAFRECFPSGKEFKSTPIVYSQQIC